MKQTKNIPELRFPGFEGEWEEKCLNEIARIERGRFSPRPRNNPIFYDGSYPFVQTSDVVNSGGRITRYSQTLNEKGLKVSRLFPRGTILITIAANIGYAGVLEIPMACPDSLIGISCNKESYNYFLNYLFQIHQKRMDYRAESAAQKNINIEFLKFYSVAIPGISEQQKIASFLSAADQRIQLLIQKKEKLEQYKKGIMQQIFSQQLRFKDDNGQEYPEWEETQFGSLYRFISTNSLSREKLNYESGHVKNIHYGDIHTKFKSHFIIDNELVPYINPDLDLKNINPDNFLKEGDLVIADASEDYNDIGKSIEICQVEEQNILAGLHTLHARRKSDQPTIGFAGHLMKSNEVRDQIKRMAQGTKVLSIAASRLSEISIKIPCQVEQHMITSLLSSLDRKITLVNQQIELTRKWKQGLLQKMFV